MIEPLINPTDAELDALTALWEASVRATHDFLAPDDIGFYRSAVRRQALLQTALYVIRQEKGSFAAFTGIDGDKIEMLFVAPDLRGRGLGRRLVQYAIDRCGARRVDCNEQNTLAAQFYARLGFRIAARDALDSADRPYPILHFVL